MSVFREIEAEEDQADLEKQRELAANKATMANVLACVHRQPVRFYNIECKHPERQAGRRCVNFDCPVLFQ